MTIDLTVGMACHNDFQGVYFTVQALRLYHADVVEACELLVVDNDPDGLEGGWTRDLVENWMRPHAGKPGHFASARYVRAPEVEGTSAPRDRVFREAAGESVLCMDCHVLLYPHALQHLLSYFCGRPDSKDIVSGPILMDDLVTYGTHFDDVWRGEMWGVWARAWACPCGFHFCPREVPGQPAGGPGVLYYPLLGGDRIDDCPGCGKLVHVTSSWWGHEGPLGSAGFVLLGTRACDAPFEIPSMGLGVFSMRRDAWPGFNPRFRGFGGEEGYIHEKVRQRGGKAVCLPGLRWVHRFTRKGQTIPHPLNTWYKLRNHVIGHQELGLPLDRLYEEFVVKGKVPRSQWEEAVAGAEWPSNTPNPEPTPFQFAREAARRRRAREGDESSAAPPAGRLAVRDGFVVVEDVKAQ